MNDFETTPPKLAVQSQASLSIGGALTLKADSVVQNYGAISIGAKAEILDDSVLQNFGTFRLGLGGDFSGQSHVTNAAGGLIEVAAGTLNVAVGIDNSGRIEVDTGGGLVLDGAAITGGAVTVDGTLELVGLSFLKHGTLNNSGVVTVEGFGALNDETVHNSGRIEIIGDAALTIDHDSNVTNAGHGAITVDNGGRLTLNSATVDGGIVTNKGGGDIDLTGKAVLANGVLANGGIFKASGQGNALHNEQLTNKGAGTIEVDGALRLDLGTVVTNAGAANTVTIDSAATLTLNGATIDGGVVTNKAGGEIDLTENAVVKNGSLGSTGTIKVSGAGNALDHETVTNTALEVTAGGTLLLDQGTSVNNSGGTITVDAASGEMAAGRLALNGATITGGTLTMAGMLQSSGISAIDSADIVNTGLIEAVGGTLTIDPVAPSTSISNSGTLQADGGELDISGEPVANTGQLRAINNGKLKLISTTVSNSGGGTISVDAGATLDLVGAGVKGGTLTNAGVLDSVSGDNVVTSAVTNTGTIEVTTGILDLAGGLSGKGQVIVDAGATLELAGADGQTITFAGDGATLQLDATALHYTGTIAGASSGGGNFTVTGAGNITSASGDGLDFTASGGMSGSPANVTLTPSGAITGALNGIRVVQNGTGDLTVEPSGSVTGLAGSAIIVQDGTAGFGNIVVHDNGHATGTGAGSVGLLVENLNAANAGNITITQTGGASGGDYGIDVRTEGNGNVLLESDGAVSADVQYGIRVRSFGTGSETITTGAHGVINSGSSGIVAVNRATSLDAAAGSTITVTANGTINSATHPNLSGSAPAGILAGYNGIGGFGSQANTNVNGTVTVNNHANIAAAVGYGIDAYNFGNGDVTVNQGAGNTVSGADYGIAALQLSAGKGDVTIDVAANATITGRSVNGLKAFSNAAGSISVSTSVGDVISAGATGILAINEAAAIAGSVHSTISIIANGTIHSGSSGIHAGYISGGISTPNSAVAGDVIVSSAATIVADAGSGINAFTYGTGDATVTTAASSSISAAGAGIDAFAFDGGKVSVTNAGIASGSTGLTALANHAGGITIINDGSLIGTDSAGIYVIQNETGATGSTHITNDSGATVQGSSTSAAIYVAESARGIFTLDNGGTIGASAISSSTKAIFESGGDFLINNSGTINGTLQLADGTFNNQTHGIWNVAGASTFGDQASTAASTINNDGTINLSGNASLHDVHGLVIANAGIIDSLSGSNSITGVITNAGTIEVAGGTLTIDAASSVTNTSAGTLEANGGDLILDGSLSGSALIAGSSSLELGANASSAYASATIKFASGSTGTLKLDHAEAFTGTIAGLDDNKLDLGDITSGANSTVSYDGVHRALTVVSNADPAQVAHINLSGDYSGSHWVTASDGNGGTTVTELPGAITAGLDSRGNATEGTLVTASITDGGEPVTDATYQWQRDGKDILNATQASYTPTEADEGHALTVRVGFVDAEHQAESSTVSAGTVQLPAVSYGVESLTTTLTFDDLSHLGAEGAIPNGYGGLDWSNFYYVNSALIVPSSGYTHGTVSGADVAFNAYANPASVSGHFNFVGAYLTGAWNNGLSISVDGYNRDTLVDHETVVVNTDAPQWYEFDYTGITRLVFSSSGGTPAGYNGAGTHFAMDNFVESTFDATANISLQGLNDRSKAVEGQTITAAVTNDNAPATGIYYTWTENGKVIHTGFDASGSTYTPTETDLGQAVRVSVLFSNAQGHMETGSISTVVDRAAPVIDTTHFTVSHDEGDADIIGGLDVTDVDSAAAAGLFTVTATTEASGSSASFATSHGRSSTDTGSLSAINTDLAAGVTYHPGPNAPQTDKVTVTVTDSFGDHDIVNFIFHQANQPQAPVVLTGTAGKDVIFGTGYGDVITGGGGADQFVFSPTQGMGVAQHTITDFDVVLDKIDLRQFSHINSMSDVSISQTDIGTLLTLDNHDTLLLKNVQVSGLHAGDFIVSPLTGSS
jgi:hypothetical protein